MRTIKTLLMTTLVISAVACKNESVIVDDSPSCEDLVAIAQADLELANVRFSELSENRSSLTSERNQLLEAGREGLSNVVSETMISELDDQIQGMDQSIRAQGETIVEARINLVEAVQNCPSSDQSIVEALDLEGSDLAEEIAKIEVAEESAREMIDRLSPMIVDTYKEIQALEDEKAAVQEERAAILESRNLSIDSIAAQVVAIDADLESIEEELLDARRRYTQFSDARRMAYLTVETTVSAAEGLENR